MLELLAIALFQIASLTGSFGTAQSPQGATPTSTGANETGGGGWGNDVTNDATGGGGWGNDIIAPVAPVTPAR